MGGNSQGTVGSFVLVRVPVFRNVSHSVLGNSFVIEVAMTTDVETVSSPRPLKCDHCGRFISWEDFYEGHAVRRLVYPDSHLTAEEYETVCPRHR